MQCFQAVAARDSINHRRRGFEVLLRKLLNYRNAPAIVILHWWSPVTQVSHCLQHRLLRQRAEDCPCL